MANSSLGRHGGWTPYFRSGRWRASERPGAGNPTSGRVRGVPPDDPGPETLLPAGSVACILGPEMRQEAEHRTSVCELRTEPARLPPGLTVRVGGPEAPEDRCLEGTEEGIRAGKVWICAGYATVRRWPKAAEGG
jgi:hypothetical protein